MATRAAPLNEPATDIEALVWLRKRPKYPVVALWLTCQGRWVGAIGRWSTEDVAAWLPLAEARRAAKTVVLKEIA